MLRSIFSLIHNIIDSDREYNNKKSSTVFYLMSNPDHTLNLDLQMEGSTRENIKTIRDDREQLPEASKSFTITTDQGDAVTCKHYSDKMIKAKPKTKVSKEEKKLEEEYGDKVEVERIGDKASFVNEEEDRNEKYAEIQGDVGMNVRELLATLPQKKLTTPEKDKEQLGALLEQIQKMKKGMERLHQIAKQFTCSEKFKQDVDFLIKNIAPDKSESKQKNLAPTNP